MDKIFFIGIGGISMSSLAKNFLTEGYYVAGSDAVKSEITDELLHYGIKIFIGHKAENITDYNIVVYNSAISEDNPELKEARRLGLRVLSRIELLNDVARRYDKVIAISGSHGKTTVTAMLAHIYSAAGTPFGAHIGGEDTKLSNCVVCKEKGVYITEACEYKKNFLKLFHTVGVILNIDSDHLDCYDDFNDLKNSFLEFAAASTEINIIPEELKSDFDKANLRYKTFGLNSSCDYSARNVEDNGKNYSFDCYCESKYLCRIHVQGIGKHVVVNALAAVCAAHCGGVGVQSIVNGIAEFGGVLRRSEYLYSYKDCDFYADYCHHPTQISETIASFYNIAKADLHIIFQPHTYSRTKYLESEFLECFKGVHNLVIYKTYAAREEYDETGSAATLAKKIKTCVYVDEPCEIVTYIKAKCKPGDICLFLGAGDIYDIGKSIYYILNS